jgi:transcriptional pleiotropic regulator of transition state genes
VRSTGIVHKLDGLGRIVIPADLRRTLGLAPGVGVEMCRDGEDVVIEKYRPCCWFCAADGELEAFKGKCVWETCLQVLSASPA